MYFEGSIPSDIKPLKEVLEDYLENTPIAQRKSTNAEELIFTQTINGTLYRGKVFLIFEKWTKINVQK